MMPRIGFFVSLCSAGVWAAPPTWSQTDLDAAAKDGQWSEVLEHATDVAPGARTDVWKMQVSKAAAYDLSSVRDPKDPLAVIQVSERLMKRFSFLEKSTEFGQARDAALAAGYQACLGAGRDDCERRLLGAKKGLSPVAALKLATAMRRAGVFAYGPMPLVAHAVAQDTSLCKDEQVRETTLAALATPPDGEVAKYAREVAFERCFGGLQAALKEAFRGAAAYYLENACKPMRQKKLLTELQTDLCEDAGQ
jgi:hypothetical protein